MLKRFPVLSGFSALLCILWYSYHKFDIVFCFRFIRFCIYSRILHCLNGFIKGINKYSYIFKDSVGAVPWFYSCVKHICYVGFCLLNIKILFGNYL